MRGPIGKRAWSIEFSRDASRELDDLDAQVARRILTFLNQRLAKLENPRGIGEALRGTPFKVWAAA